MKEQITYCDLGCFVRGCICRVTRSAHHSRVGLVASCDDHDPNKWGYGLPLPRGDAYVPEAPATRVDLWIPDAPMPPRPAALGGAPEAPQGPSGGQRVRPLGPKAPRPSGGGAAVQLVAANVTLKTGAF